MVSVFTTIFYSCQLRVCNQGRHQLKFFVVFIYILDIFIFSLLHQLATGATKHATSQKHCLTSEILAEHDQLTLLYISHELYLIQILFKNSLNSILLILSIDYS